MIEIIEIKEYRSGIKIILRYGQWVIISKWIFIKSNLIYQSCPILLLIKEDYTAGMDILDLREKYLKELVSIELE